MDLDEMSPAELEQDLGNNNIIIPIDSDQFF
jgi:hypothetical protein